MRHNLTLVLGLTLLVVPLAASAQAPAPDEPALAPASAPASAPAQPAEDPLVRARSIFATGAELYRQGKYDQALEQFEAALKLARRPSILFNIAQCHRQLGHKQLALQRYEAHLAEWEKQNPGKPSPHREEIRGHIERLRAELERDRERERREKLQQTVQAEEAERQAALTKQLEQRRRRKSLIGYTVLGAGAALVVAAGVLYAVGGTQGSEAYDKYKVAEDPDEIAEHRADVESAQSMLIAGHVLVGVGVAAAAYGIYELVTRPSVASSGGEREEGQVSLRLAPTSGGAGFVIGGRF